jgi:hypothetical protein
MKKGTGGKTMIEHRTASRRSATMSWTFAAQANTLAKPQIVFQKNFQ